METAEEFATKLVARVWDRMRLDWGAVRQYEEATREIEARDNATRLTAKLEALDDFVALTFREFAYPHAIGTELAEEVREKLRLKYRAEAQPVQPEERR